MNSQEERIHDEEEWIVEAKAVINDVKECVKEIVIASVPSSNSAIYCNLTILEGDKYCIELTAAGFRIVGATYDTLVDPREEFYETPYSLLDCISPLYREKFSSSLAVKLSALAEERSSDSAKETE